MSCRRQCDRDGAARRRGAGVHGGFCARVSCHAYHAAPLPPPAALTRAHDPTGHVPCGPTPCGVVVTAASTAGPVLHGRVRGRKVQDQGGAGPGHVAGGWGWQRPRGPPSAVGTAAMLCQAPSGVGVGTTAAALQTLALDVETFASRTVNLHAVRAAPACMWRGRAWASQLPACAGCTPGGGGGRSTWAGGRSWP